MAFSAESYLALIRGERRGPFAGLARLGLRGVSVPYGVGVRVRNVLFDHGVRTVHHTAVPVVSVGNLSLGGTGKTPCVEAVARFYREQGVQVVVLSRGYGADAGRNDEAMVLEENLPDVPHLQGADRVALAATAVEELEAELLILDDGFQHRRLHRDLDIVLIDATRPASRDWLFPRGTLREPVSSLRRAGILMLTRCDQSTEADGLRLELERRFPGQAVVMTEHRPDALRLGDAEESLEKLRGATVAAFCGIGNPAAFRRTLETLGASVREFRRFPDHHAYSRADVDDLRRWAGMLPQEAMVVTTQKDMVKLRLTELAGRPCLALRIGLALTHGEAAFHDHLRRLVPAVSEDQGDEIP